MAGNTRPGSPGQAERIVAVLGSFDTTRRRQTLTQICRRSGLPLSTTHRIVTELCRLGMLQQDAEGLYMIGVRVWEMGMLSARTSLRQVAAPFMQDLLAATRQVVNLFVLDGDRARLLERISGSAVGAPIAVPGDRLPLGTSAGGKVLLSQFVGDPEALRGLATGPHGLFTGSELARLEVEVAAVHRRGWATTSEEYHRGAWGLAVPVYDHGREVLAALGVVSLTPISSPTRVLPALQVTAAAISRALAGRAA